MSQSSLFTGVAARIATAPAPATQPGGVREDDRRSADPIDVLGRRLDPVCTSAVDALEIAAALEADGLTDVLASERYGLPDVFSLAHELHRRIPLRPRPVAEAPADITVNWSCVGRGVLFALPAIYFLAIEDAISSRVATIVLVAVTIGGWAASQAISIAAHTVLAQRGRSATLGFLRLALTIAVLGAVVLAGVAVVLGWESRITAVAIALGLYIVAATVLVFLGADLVLAMMLAPGAMAAGLSAIADPSWLGWRPLVFTLGVSVTLVVAAAAFGTRGAVRAGAIPHRAEVARTLPFVAYGALAGGLVAAPLIAALVTGARATSLLALAMLPLTLSMGFAEFELRRHSRSVRRALGREHDVAGFVHVASRGLWMATARYAVALAAIAALLLSIVAARGVAIAGTTAQMAGYMLLGVALFLGLVIGAGGRVGRVAAGIAVASALFAALTAAGLAVEAAFAVACGVLLVSIAAIADRDVKKIVTHR